MKITSDLLEKWKSVAQYELSVNPLTGQDADLQKYAKIVLQLIEHIETEKRNQ